MTNDPTEQARRDLLDEMPAECVAAIGRSERVWDRDAMTAEFEVIGFLAPFVIVRRRSDGKKGSLMFTHRPRYYFGFELDHSERGGRR
jgi:hypothetical protein